MKKQIIAIVGAFTLMMAAMTNTASATSVKVEKGDTLWTLSQKHNASVESIKKLNNLHSTLIYAGSTLQIEQGKSKGSTIYIIKIGDTLNSISQKTGIPVKKLISYNHLSSDLIIAGSTLALTNKNQKIIPGKKPVVKKTVTKRKTTPVSNPVEKVEPKKVEATPAPTSSKTMTMKATAYTAECTGCSGITATGIDVRNSTPKLIAVDPSVIPLGSKVWVEGYGEAIAGDTGGAIKGNRVDLLVASHGEAMQYGVHTVQVKVLN